jgi:hypothetical protein
MIQPLYRVEVGASRSHAWLWFVRLAKRFKSYRVTVEDGLEIHAVETRSVGDLSALYEIIRSWKGWAFYIDGRPAPRADLVRMAFQYNLERGRNPLGPRPMMPPPQPDVPF